MASVNYLLKLPTVMQGVLNVAKTHPKHYEESRKHYSFFCTNCIRVTSMYNFLRWWEKLLVSYLFQFVFQIMVLPLYVPLAALIRFIKVQATTDHHSKRD